MAASAGLGFHPAGQLHLGHALPQDVTDTAGHGIRLSGGLAHQGQFVGRFDGSHLAQTV